MGILQAWGLRWHFEGWVSICPCVFGSDRGPSVLTVAAVGPCVVAPLERRLCPLGAAGSYFLVSSGACALKAVTNPKMPSKPVLLQLNIYFKR